LSIFPLYERGLGGFIKLSDVQCSWTGNHTLINEQLKPGVYEIEWNAAIIPAVYFYKIVSVDFSETKKMVLIKYGG